MEKFLRDSESCLQRNASRVRTQALRAVVGNLTAVGEHFLGKAITSWATESTDSTITDVIDTDTAVALTTTTEGSLVSSVDFKTVGTNISKAFSTLGRAGFAARNPEELNAAIKNLRDSTAVSSLARITGSLFDVFAADSSISEACPAEATIKEELAALDNLVSTAETQLSEIDRQLEEAGPE